jgi:DNA-binding NarL/FixJ family response regulator
MISRAPELSRRSTSGDEPPPSVAPTRPIRVLIVDAQPIVRQGLEAVLAGHLDLTVVGSTPFGPEALTAVETTAPDVMVVEPESAERHGLGFLNTLRARRSSVKVLVFSNNDGDEVIHEALERGAVGYLLKTTAVSEVVAAIRTAARGRVRPSPEVAARLADRLCYSPLSEREIEVLKQAAGGRSNKQIGSDLDLSESTVKNHMRSIMAKLQASDRTQSVTLALRRGIIDVAACYGFASVA